MISAKHNYFIFILNTMRMLSLNRSDVTHIIFVWAERSLDWENHWYKLVVFTCLLSKMLSKLVTYVMSPQWQCSACIYTADRQYA